MKLLETMTIDELAEHLQLPQSTLVERIVCWLQ
jgi:hypothetical protein